MLTTPLTETHRKLDAKLVNFAGYAMPLTYSGLKEEHLAVREAAGIFDVSHMGEFIIRGSGARTLVQRLTSNDVDKISPGQAQYSCLPTPGGGIIDDLLVYHLPPSPAMGMQDDGPSYMLVVNASNIEKDMAWVQQHNADIGATVLDISAGTALLAVQGPKAVEILQPLTDTDLAAIPYYRFERGRLAGVDNVIISATGYTGAGGFELYFSVESAERVWSAILEAGRPHGLLPAGLGARDTLRLEKGYCLYGNELTDTTSPLEAGLGWITKLDADDFVGRDYLLRQKEEGLSRRLVGIEVDDRRAPRHGYPLLSPEGEPIGEVTSGSHIPGREKPIGMGYVRTGYHKTGTPLLVDMGRKQVEGRVVRL